MTKNQSPSSTIRITVPIKPVAWTRPRFDSKSKRVFNTKKLTDYENQIALFAKAAMRGRPPFTGEIKLSAEFYRPKPKTRKGQKPQVSFIGDADRYLNAVMDSLIGVCYLDDRQVVDARAIKLFGEPNVIIELEEL